MINIITRQDTGKEQDKSQYKKQEKNKTWYKKRTRQDTNKKETAHWVRTRQGTENKIQDKNTRHDTGHSY